MLKKIFLIILCCFLVTPTVFATTYSIEVNTKKCTVSVYEQTKSGWQLIGKQKCCLGANGKTPKGEFTIKKKEKSFEHDGLHYDYVSYFSGKCAFHSTPRNRNKYDNSSLGHHRSGGCIRLKPNAAKWIYKYCKEGTKVKIK